MGIVLSPACLNFITEQSLKIIKPSLKIDRQVIYARMTDRNIDYVCEKLCQPDCHVCIIECFYDNILFSHLINFSFMSRYVSFSKVSRLGQLVNHLSTECFAGSWESKLVGYMEICKRFRVFLAISPESSNITTWWAKCWPLPPYKSSVRIFDFWEQEAVIVCPKMWVFFVLMHFGSYFVD